MREACVRTREEFWRKCLRVLGEEGGGWLVGGGGGGVRGGFPIFVYYGCFRRYIMCNGVAENVVFAFPYVLVTFM